MKPARGYFACCVAFFACALASPVAIAAFETTTNNAALLLRAEDTPEIIGQGSCSILFYFRPSELPASGERPIFTLDDSIQIVLDENGDVTARLRFDAVNGNDGDPPIERALSPGQALIPGKFALFALSIVQSTNEINFWLSQGGSDPSLASLTESDLRLRTPTGGINLASIRQAPPIPGAQGLYDVFVVRNHRLNEVDIQALLANRRAYDLLDLDTRLQGGWFNSGSGVQLMFNHAILAEPLTIEFEPANPPSSIIGQPVPQTAFPAIVNVPFSFGLNYSLPVLSANGLVYRSHFEDEFGGYFQKTAVEAPGLPPMAPQVSPRANAFAHGIPDGLTRVIVSGNSRAVRLSEQFVSDPNEYVGPRAFGSFMDGFYELYAAQMAGAIFVPTLPVMNVPFFGFDTTSDEARIEGEVASVNGLILPAHTFGRFWTSSPSASGFGPGAGTFLYPECSYTLKAKPEGLLRADEPLRVEAHVLAFPGASSVAYSAAKEDRQSGGTEVLAGELGVNSFVESLDTTRETIILGEDEAIPFPERTLALNGDFSDQIFAGDAITADQKEGIAITTVRSITFDGTRTLIVLRTPFLDDVPSGATIRFGPWEHRKLAYTWPALAKGDPLTWRGLRIEALDDGAGLPLYAFSCYRPGVDGFVFGAAGWSGNGYDVQLAGMHPGVLESIARESGAHIWFQTPAQQQSEPASMTRYIEEVSLGLDPTTEVVWAGEPTHSDLTGLIERKFEDWHGYVLTEGPAHGYPSLSVLTDPDIGDYKTQAIDGRRIENAHISRRGNILIVEKWMEQLRDASRLAGDCDGDRAIDFNDLICSLSRFGEAHGPADCDRSGTVDFGDLVCALANFSTGE